MHNNSCAIIIKGVHTDIALKVYSNRILLIISQVKKFGSMITVSRETAIRDFGSDVYSIKTLFGKDDPDSHVAARYIAEQIGIDRAMLLSICIKDYDIETLKPIVFAINQLKSW